jgi:hypothetical protein
MYFVRRPRFNGGVPPDIFESFLNIKEEIINRYNLKAETASMEKLRAKKLLTGTTDTEQAMEYWFWKNGGRKEAHFHFDGNVYPLNQEQWKAFSQGVMAVVSKKLAAAGAVSFESAGNILEAMSNERII